jgi:rhodanese-related sulfurtransferase
VLFSGGSLLAGGTARTDLIAPDQTAALTRAQFRSITRAFRDLEDETLLLPTHGGGSFCSAGSGGERTSTLGHERRTNPLLAFDDEDSFADWFPTTFPAAPAYFFRLRAVNRAGPRLRELIAPPAALPAREFDRARPGAVVLDLRPQAEFMRGHIPGALSIAFRDAFATWLGWLVPPESRLLFVLGAEPLRAVLDECLLVGYEQFAGALAGGMPAWESAGLPVEQAKLIDARAAKELLQDGAVALDVRERDEFQAGFIPGAIHVPLGEMASQTLPFAPDTPIVTYCGHGERSATGLSILAARAFRNVVNLDGGIGAWAASKFPLQRMEEGGLSQ